MSTADYSAAHSRPWPTSPHYEHVRAPPPPAQNEAPFDERLCVDFILDNNQRRVDPSLTSAHHQPPANNATVGQYAPLSLVPHLTLPRILPPTCPLDTVMMAFLRNQHAQAAQGVPLHLLSGPAYPNFTALAYPDRQVDAHPLSKLFTDIIRTFPDVGGLPEQVAIVYIMFLVMRWQIEPTPENYDRLPEWVTPRASQLFVPHPYWFNHLPWYV